MNSFERLLLDGAIGIVGDRVVMAAGLSVEGPLNLVLTIHSSGEGWERMSNMKTSVRLLLVCNLMVNLL